MLGHTIEVLAPCLSFTKTYSTIKEHNMMAIMIDMRHKILKVIQEYMEIYIVLSIVEEYIKASHANVFTSL
jgi:hypothetical protein